MIVTCPNCGTEIMVNAGGRKPLSIPFRNVSNTLQACRSIELAANELGCSRGYIYQELKKRNKKPRDYMK